MENPINDRFNFMSSKYNDEERVMHSKSDNMKADEVIGELFQ